MRVLQSLRELWRGALFVGDLELRWQTQRYIIQIISSMSLGEGFDVVLLCHLISDLRPNECDLHSSTSISLSCLVPSLSAEAQNDTVILY